MKTVYETALSKVPEVTLLFWVIKIAATTLGETGGDAVSMSMNLGYLWGTAIFAGVFLIAVAAQIKAKGFHPWLYWTTIIATTTVGTTLADFADRSLGIGYAGGSALLLLLLAASLALWYRTLGTVSVDVDQYAEGRDLLLGDHHVLADAWARRWATGRRTPRVLGMKAAHSSSGPCWRCWSWPTTRPAISRTLLFWLAFILTRPLGAVLGDLLDKPLADGGLALSRYSASLALLVLHRSLSPAVPASGGREGTLRV